MFEASKWVWLSGQAQADEYCEFFTAFEVADVTQVLCRLSCDSDYTLFVNGTFVDSNQYGAYEHYKVYDELDITGFVKPGQNTLSVLVWYFGENTHRYKKAPAGLIFEIAQNDRILTASNEDTLARLSPVYRSHRCGRITSQLGFGFHYDATRFDGSFFTGEGFGRAVSVEKNCTFYKRPCEKLQLAERKSANYTSDDDGRHWLVDLGEETVGLLTMQFTTAKQQDICVAWGEDLPDGHVKRLLGNRNFSIGYTAIAGQNDYTNYMLRIAGRYLEVWAEEPIDPVYISLIPQYYPAVKKQVKLADPLDQQIYDLCTHTLRLCMMEHYVDCPWREQSFYAYDGRNQMLCGYYAFEKGNAAYARANLKLMSRDDKADGLLSICFPTGRPVAIPSFSLQYFTAVWEYYTHTGDKTLLEEVYPKLLALTKPFRENMENDLLCSFGGEGYWNFYDWSAYLDGWAERGQPRQLHSVINFLYVIALDKLEKIANTIGQSFAYKGEADKLRENIKEVFFDQADGLFSFRPGQKEYTELANALAILSGTVDGPIAAQICQKLCAGKTSESSLSLKCFLYDALLMTDHNYQEWVLSQIRSNYGYMLSCGATTAWETIGGGTDFDNAGSLCHGWSAIPVYYYHRFGMIDK